MYSNQKCFLASRKTSTFLYQKAKEPETVCFFKDAMSQCTYNRYSVFSHSQLAICYYVTQQIDLDRFRRITMFVSPTTIKYATFIFNPDLPKDHNIKIFFKEVSIGQAPEQIFLCGDLKCTRHQYGLCHYVTGNFHGAMGDTYNCMTILVIHNKKSFSLWYHG